MFMVQEEEFVEEDMNLKVIIIIRANVVIINMVILMKDFGY